MEGRRREIGGQQTKGEQGRRKPYKGIQRRKGEHTREERTRTSTSGQGMRRREGRENRGKEGGEGDEGRGGREERRGEEGREE